MNLVNPLSQNITNEDKEKQWFYENHDNDKKNLSLSGHWYGTVENLLSDIRFSRDYTVNNPWDTSSENECLLYIRILYNHFIIL